MRSENIDRQIALEIAKTKGLSIAKLGLRFDRVVIRLVGDLRAFAEKAVPKGATILVTVTAPIRLPAKTVATLERRFTSLLARKMAPKDQSVGVHGNRVRIRLLKHASKKAPKLVGFVHNPDSRAKLLFDLAEEVMLLRSK